MRMNRANITGFACAAAVLLGAQLSHHADAGTPATKVFLNGKPAPVYFNDGDSFRVLKGPMKGAKARIAGYNTLETHGPVHSWGSWDVKEMFHLAKMATLHARRGVWECETDGKTDTYGRMLVKCHKLGEELIRLGLAHALTVTDEPGHPDYLAAQKEAMAAKRGIWAHGIPDFILTSLHSAEEDIDGRGTYNRLVSTADGHSVKWRHGERYQECENVCQMVYAVDDAAVAAVSAALRADPAAGIFIAELAEDKLTSVVRDFAAYRHVNREIAEDKRRDFHKILAGYAAQGQFGNSEGQPASCMVHVAFKRRYGTGKASCLK